MSESADVAIVGAGAAGLMAAIWRGRSAPHERVVLLDGARSLGAKILVAGGGRCNVTHDVVDERAFAGSTPAAIRSVLRRFDADRTIEFFRELGVELKREETGKLFPVTDRARTVLDALLGAARQAGVRIVHPWRVQTIRRAGEGFAIEGPAGTMHAARVILATGGRSLPKSGSDGHGYEIATSLGHSLTPRIFPALVPLVLPDRHFLRELSGISTTATVEVRSSKGRKLTAFTDSILCTHFGLSGPGVLDISRFLIDARVDDPGAALIIRWMPAWEFQQADEALQQAGRAGIANWLGEHLPQRLARSIVGSAGIDAAAPGHTLTRDQRRTLARALVEMNVPVTGDRGYGYAEVTAGGIPLREIDLRTMESRRCQGLRICGEICDVDGRIGGYNFQWAWASGYLAGRAGD